MQRRRGLYHPHLERRPAATYTDIDREIPTTMVPLRSIDVKRQLFFVSCLKAVLLSVVFLMFLILIVCNLSAAPRSTWNDARLASVAAWVHGYPFYTPENSGILTSNYYPPLGTLAFLPAALINHPVPAIIVGSLLMLLMNLSTAIGALMLWSHGQRVSRELLPLGAALFFGLLIITP